MPGNVFGEDVAENWMEMAEASGARVALLRARGQYIVVWLATRMLEGDQEGGWGSSWGVADVKEREGKRRRTCAGFMVGRDGGAVE
jgi:hypothetical protein